MRRNPSGFASVNNISFFKLSATFYKSYLPKERWSDPDPSHIHTDGLAMEQKLFYHFLFHHLQHIAQTTNFMQNKKLMLQLKSSLQGLWRKIILFTKHDLSFGKTCSFPHVSIFQNTSLFVSLFSICKCFQCLKVKFVDFDGHLLFYMYLSCTTVRFFLSFFFDCLIIFFINFPNIILIIFNQLVTKC